MKTFRQIAQRIDAAEFGDPKLKLDHCGIEIFYSDVFPVMNSGVSCGG